MTEQPEISVDSPCISVCVVQQDHCIGCFRTLDEIARWGSMSRAERQQVMDALPERINRIFGA